MAKSQKNPKKKNNLRAYAPAGLWVSGVSLAATIILLVLKALTLVNLFTPKSTKQFNLWIWVFFGFIIVGLAIFALLDPRRVREFFSGRQAKYGSTTLIKVFALLGILLVANLIVFNFPKTWDLTAEKKFTLAPETIDTLKALPAEVHAIAFYTSQNSTETTSKLFSNLKTHSDGKFTYEFVDPDQNPVLAKQLGITGDGKIYLSMGETHDIVSSASETDITSGLLRLMSPGERVVYFLAGHGEHNIDSGGEAGYTKVKATLEAKNYTVESLNLLAEGSIPNDAKVIIIAGPYEPISASEMTLLEGYVTNGGALIVMEDPTSVTNLGKSPDPLAEYLKNNWGIQLENNIIIDTNSNQVLFAVADQYGNHPITEKLKGIVSYYPQARSITLLPDAPNSPTAIVQTTSRSWGETDFAGMEQNKLEFNPETDIAGPLTIAVAASDYATNARVVVLGDSDFASDTFYDQYANGDMLINIIDWAAGQEAMINLTPGGTAVDRQLKPISNTTMILLAIGILCVLPLLIIAGGVAAWLARRLRG
jgi:ABC-type uncharacterized transport system involved in gliding motility auxiliary subunit